MSHYREFKLWPLCLWKGSLRYGSFDTGIALAVSASGRIHVAKPMPVSSGSNALAPAQRGPCTEARPQRSRTLCTDWFIARIANS